MAYLMSCPNCHGNTIQPVAKSGRQLAGYARTAEGTKLVIPSTLLIDTCLGCSMLLPTDTQKEALAEFERGQVGPGAFPL